MTSPAVDDDLREEDTNNRPELAPIQPDLDAPSSGDHNDHVNLSPKAAELHLDSNARWREAATHAEGKVGRLKSNPQFGRMTQADFGMHFNRLVKEQLSRDTTTPNLVGNGPYFLPIF